MLWQFQGNSQGAQPYIYMYPLSLNPFPTQAGTWHWIEFHVLHSRSLLVIHFKYSGVYMDTIFKNLPSCLSFSSQLPPSQSWKMPAAPSYSLNKTVLYLTLKPPLALFLVWVSRSLSFHWVSPRQLKPWDHLQLCPYSSCSINWQSQ